MNAKQFWLSIWQVVVIIGFFKAIQYINIIAKTSYEDIIGWMMFYLVAYFIVFVINECMTLVEFDKCAWRDPDMHFYSVKSWIEFYKENYMISYLIIIFSPIIFIIYWIVKGIVAFNECLNKNAL